MDRYYYDTRRDPSRRRGKGSRTIDFLFPFLVLIVVGIVFVLGFRLLISIYGDDDGEGVYLYVDSGAAQIKMWGTDDFVKAYDGTKILQGDELYTARDSRVVVQGPDGLLLRVAGDTSIIFNEIYKDGDGTEVQLVLDNGEVWVNRTNLDSIGVDVMVLTDNVLIRPVVSADGAGAVFDVLNVDGVESARVLYGAVDIDVYSENGGTTVDHVGVSIGEQAVFDIDRLLRFWKFQAPNVVEGINTEVKESAWYLWNLMEDENPTDFSALVIPEEVSEEEVEVLEEVVEVVVPEEEVEVPEAEVEVPALNLGVLGDLVITEVNGVVWDESMFEQGISVVGEPIKIVGNVSGAMDILVNGYELQRFEPSEGQEVFVYWLKEEYENLVPGENVYEVYALAEDGTRGVSVYFKVIWEKPEPAEPEPEEPAEVPAEEL